MPVEFWIEAIALNLAVAFAVTYLIIALLLVNRSIDNRYFTLFAFAQTGWIGSAFALHISLWLNLKLALSGLLADAQLWLCASIFFAAIVSVSFLVLVAVLMKKLNRLFRWVVYLTIGLLPVLAWLLWRGALITAPRLVDGQYELYQFSPLGWLIYTSFFGWYVWALRLLWPERDDSLLKKFWWIGILLSFCLLASGPLPIPLPLRSLAMLASAALVIYTILWDGIILKYIQRTQELESEVVERRRAEDEVHRLNIDLERRVVERTAQLEAANKELEAFTYSVSHDLRAPLHGIQGFSQVLLEDYSEQLDSTASGYLEQIQRGIKKLQNLIDNLLTLSRVNRATIQRVPLDLSALVDEICLEMGTTRFDHCVRADIQPGLNTQADERLLRLALENMIGNAYKFTARQPQASLEFGSLPADSQEETAEQVYFVRDNGVGFNMKYYEKMFVEFERLHGDHEFPGSGIGLSIVQRVITRHGGRIWAEAIEGQGATFYFTLGV